MLITLVYLCIDENIFSCIFYYLFDKCVYIQNVFINSFIYYMINY
jgi:hypothetical protein